MEETIIGSPIDQKTRERIMKEGFLYRGTTAELFYQNVKEKGAYYGVYKDHFIDKALISTTTSQ